MSKPQSDIIQEIITAIQFSQRFLVATHIRPDGDAIGSVLAMTQMLHHLGKQADPYCNDPVPVPYRFLSGVQAIRDRVSQPSLYEVAILVDCGEFFRVGTALAEAITHVPFLDYHRSPCLPRHLWEPFLEQHCGKQHLRDALRSESQASHHPRRRPCHRPLYRTAHRFGFLPLFQHQSTGARDCRPPGRCRSRTGHIAEQVYDSASVESLQLLARILATLSFYADDRLATAEMTQEMFSETASSPSDAEGFINFLRSVKTVEMAMLFREGADGTIHVSMRSKGNVDVASFAQRRGGGDIAMRRLSKSREPSRRSVPASPVKR